MVNRDRGATVGVGEIHRYATFMFEVGGPAPGVLEVIGRIDLEEGAGQLQDADGRRVGRDEAVASAGGCLDVILRPEPLRPPPLSQALGCRPQLPYPLARSREGPANG